MEIILCHPRVSAPRGGGWTQCQERTTTGNTAGWSLTREGDFCPNHAAMTTGGSAA